MESVSIFLFFVSVQDLKKPAILTTNSVFPQVRMLTMDNDRLLQEREREKANNSRSVFLQTPFPSFLACLPHFWSVLPYLVDLHRFVGISSGSFLVEVPPLVEPCFYSIFSRSYTELKQEFEGEVTRWEG